MYTKKTKIIGAMLALIMLLQIFCTSITSVVLATEAASQTEVTFVDANLYAAIKELVKSKLSSYSDKDQTITISNANIATITSLDLSKKEIRDLSGIENFTSLKELDLTSNKLKNIDELGSLTNLEELTLANNNIEDCTVLESLSNLNEERITLGSQNIEKVVAINSDDIEEYSFTYVLPQIFKYIQKIKTANNEKMDMSLTIINTQGYGLADNGQYTLNEETFELVVQEVEEQGLATIEIRYDSKTGQDTTLLVHLLAIPDDEKLGIVFEDENLYYAVKANIEGTEANTYLDSKYPIIRDDNEGCVWYDDILSLVINRHYLYKDIVELDLVNKKIENLEGLQYFVGLSDLDLSNNFISDVSVLEELVNQKANGEADLKEKVKEIYDELVKNIDEKEEALSLLTLQGRKASINSVISEMKSYIGSIPEEELDSETKSELNTYFLNEIEADSLASTSIGNNTNVSNLINGNKAVIGTNKIDKTDCNCEVTIGGNTIYYDIPRSGEYDEGSIKITSSIVDYIINQFKVIQKINNGYVEVDGEFINVDNLLEDVVIDIQNNIEDLEKYVDIEKLLLILPKETIELTEAEVESLTLTETRELAKEIINTFKSALNTLTAEEVSVAFDISISYIDTVDEYNETLTVITDKMNDDLSAITDEEDESYYIGDDKYELQDIIFEYIAYQKGIIQSHNILDGIDIGYKKQILSSEIMEYTDSELSDLSLAGAKRLALEAIYSFITEYKNGELSDIENYIIDFPTQAEMEETYRLIQEGNYNYDTKNELVNVIKEYRNYQNILLKEVIDLSVTELKLLTYEKVKDIAIVILERYIEEYDTLNGLNITKENIETLYDNVKASTLNGGGSYDTVAEIVNNVITVYKGYQAKIDDVYRENFTSKYVNYSDYIKEALLEANTTNNYMDTNINTSYRQDQADVKNIISRFKGVNFDEVIALPKIKVLNISSNNLTDISKLTNITTLVELNVSDNIIRDLTTTDFTKFEKLNTLDLSHNRIYETNIGIIPNLENLNLSYNYIENIDGMQLSAFTKLQSINLGGNRIYDLQPIMYNLYQIAKVQERNRLVPIVTWTNSDGIFASWTDLKEFGYVASKDKVNFEGQTIYASVSDKIMQGTEEYIKLPAIFNQVKYIDCGETNFLNAKATNDGMIMYLDTSILGERNDVAEIQGTGVATGTKCYVTYTIATEEEVKTIPVTNIFVQEEVVLDDENASMPDLTGDGKVTSADVDKIVEYVRNTEFVALADIVPDEVINEYDYLLLKEYVTSGWNSNNLTLEQRQKASEADINADGVVDNKDLEALALHILNIKTNSSTSIADINSDGKLDAKDANMLSKYIVSKSTERRNTDAIALSILNEYKETRQLHANILPEDATDKTVTWISNNENIVKVDEKGKVTAVGEGTTTINVASVSNPNVYKTIRVDVTKAANIVEDINIVVNEETGNPNIKQNYYIGEDLDLAGAKLEVSRRDGSKEILDITADMLEGFTTETVGEKLVTVTYEDVTTTFEIKVTEYNEPKVDITIDNLDVKLPENVVYDGQEHLAEVALKEGVKAGELTIAYKDETGNDIEKPVNAGVYKVIANITDSIYANQAEIEVGEFTIAKAELPEDQRPNIATEYTVEKDGSLNVTAENGIITIPEGTAFDEVGTKDVTLTFVPNDTNYASIEIPVKVNVVISVTGVNLNKTEYIIVKGGETHLTATVSPENATNRNVTWTTSDENIAKVEDGKVIAIGVGEAIITVTTKDGEKSTTCKIIVKEQVYTAKELEDGTVAITGINPETTEEYFRDKFLSENTYKIFKADGTTELTSNDTIATGYILKVYDENGTPVEEQILVVKGDTDGDGRASATDSGSILAHRTGEKELKDEYLLAADINNDEQVDGRDSTLLIYHRIGMAGYILQNN